MSVLKKEFLNKYRNNKIKMNEQYETMTDEERSQRVSDIIERLKIEDFGNEEQRLAFSALIHELAISKNPEARKYIKELGKIMSNWSEGNFNPPEIEDEIIEDEIIEDEVIEKKIIIQNNRYKPLFD